MCMDISSSNISLDDFWNYYGPATPFVPPVSPSFSKQSVCSSYIMPVAPLYDRRVGRGQVACM